MTEQKYKASGVEPVRTIKTNHEFVRESLRSAILLGELPPGTRLVQADIAKQLDVSTTPVREALRDLAAEGLVRLDAFRGALVTPLDQDDLTEIFELLQALEPVAIRHAVSNITEDDLARAEALLEQIDRHPDGAEFVSLDREFHGIFAEAAHAPRLKSMIESLRDSAGLYISVSFRHSVEMVATANADHRKLVKAMRERDTSTAMSVEREHLVKAHDRWLTSVAASSKAATPLVASPH